MLNLKRMVLIVLSGGLLLGTGCGIGGLGGSGLVIPAGLAALLLLGGGGLNLGT